jgi:hypothetical protein
MCPRLLHSGVVKSHLPIYCALALLASGATGADVVSLDVEAADPPPPVGSAIFAIDARSSFLRTHAETVATDARAIDLRKLGLKPGNWIRLDVLGDFSWSANELPEIETSLSGVFSKSATLLPADSLERIPDAIDSGSEVATARTLYRLFATDIAEDFPIQSSKLQIPRGARFLFVAAPDIFYSDNADRDGNFALRITVL